MSERAWGLLRAVARPTYVVAALLVFLPLIDLATNIWPPRAGQVQWRFGSVGLLSGFLLTPLLGIVMAVVAAATLEHRRALRAIGIACFIGAGGLALAVPLFALDWLQMRAGAPPEALNTFDVGAVRTMFKHLLVAASLGWLGAVSVRQAKGGERSRSRATPLVRTSETGTPR